MRHQNGYGRNHLEVGCWHVGLRKSDFDEPQFRFLSRVLSVSGEPIHSECRFGTTAKSQCQPMSAISRSARIKMICRRAHNDRGSDALRSPPLEESALPCPIVKLPKPRQIRSSPLGVSNVNSALRRYPQNTPKPSKRDEFASRKS